MKKLLLASAFLLLLFLNSYAQCIPDPTIIDPGIYPDTVTNLPSGTTSVFYDTNIQLKVLTDTAISPGLVVSVLDITIDSVNGLPAGFAYSCNPPTCVFPGGSNDCIRLFGTNAVAGTYNLTVYVTLNGTLFGFPVSQASTVTGYKITLNAPVAPIALFNASSVDICEDQSITFTDQSQNTPDTYEWIFPGGTPASSSNQNPSVTYDGPGTFDVTLIVSNAAGSDTLHQTAYVNVNAKPVAHISPGGVLRICAGQSITLLANTGANLSYQWYRYSNLLAGETNQSIQVSAGGSYKVLVTETTTGCTKRSGLRTVNVLSLPAVSIAASGPVTFCRDSSVELIATTNPANTIEWTNGGITIPGATGSNYETFASGYFRASVMDVNGCSKLSPGIVVTVKNLPDNSITASGSLTFCQGDSVILNAQPVAGNTFQWEEDFISIPAETAVSYTAYNAGKYTFTVTGSNGCSRRSAVRKVVVNCREALVGIATSFAGEVFPNPASESANIKIATPESGKLVVELRDVSGRYVATIYNESVEKGAYIFQINLEGIPEGIYLIKTTLNNFSGYSKLVIN